MDIDIFEEFRRQFECTRLLITYFYRRQVQDFLTCLLSFSKNSGSVLCETPTLVFPRQRFAKPLDPEIINSLGIFTVLRRRDGANSRTSVPCANVLLTSIDSMTSLSK
jgi:hypothetical protein